jgi:hypothetical protein
MRQLMRHPWFFGWLAWCALLAAGGSVWLVRLRQTLFREKTTLERKAREFEELARSAPLPLAANEEAAKIALEAAARRLAETRTELVGEAGSEPASASVPTNSVEAYFDLCAMVERLRALAVGKGMAIKADERFGFSSYANEGPALELLAQVLGQARLVERAVEILGQSGPRELLAVQREKPETLATDHVADAGADFFKTDARTDLRTKGLIGGHVVRLRFSGTTKVLRDFLNDLAAQRRPLVVRSVDVEPAPATPLRTKDKSEAPAPFVAQTGSIFSVVVQSLELDPPPPAASR